jgi:two-component system nitrogen regulation response regulator GlnG
MPMEAQTRLLRVLQQGEYTTVGGRTPIKTDVRIVAATNKDLRVS